MPSAASVGWRLRYIKGAPSSENVVQDLKWITYSDRSVYMTCDSVCNGAVVSLEMKGEQPKILSKPGRTHVINKVHGERFWCEASYYNCRYGNATNYPSGRVIY